MFFFRPPKFDIDAVLQKKRIKDKHRWLKQKRLLQAYLAPATLSQTLSPPVQETTEMLRQSGDNPGQIEEFHDFNLDYYDSSSGAMSDDDYS